MRIFGKSVSEYLAFQRLVLLLILAIGFLRLTLSLAGLPVSQVRWFSLTWLSLLGVCYYGIRSHTEGFGTFRHLLPLVLIQGALVQAIIIGGIVWGIFTGQDNIFTSPEFTVNPFTGERGVDGKTWMHAGGHAIFGLIVGTLMLWGIACLIFWVAGKAAPRKADSTVNVS